MRNDSEKKLHFVNSIPMLEEVLSDDRNSYGFNLYIAKPNSKPEILSNHTCVFFYNNHRNNIVIDAALYSSHKDEVENTLKKNAEKRKNRIIDRIDDYFIHPPKFNKWISFGIDPYINDFDFIKKAIKHSKDENLTVHFHATRPSKESLEILKEAKADLSRIDSDDIIVSYNTDYFSKDDLTHIIGTFFPSYIKLLTDIDSLVISDKIEEICVFNKEESPLQYTDPSYRQDCEYRVDSNYEYLTNMFTIVKKIREKGYDGPIDIMCNSLLDVCNSMFLYDSKNVTFNGYTVSIARDVVDVLKKLSQEFLSSGDSSLSEKLNYIYLSLHIHFGSNIKITDNLDRFVNSSVLYDMVYDFCRLLGLKPIKSNTSDNFYFFEKGNNKVVCFNPLIMETIFSNCQVDMYNVKTEQKVWEMAFSKFNERDVIYDYDVSKYLNANSIDEIRNIFLKSVDKEHNLYLHDVDPYIFELNFLLNVIMDLSEDDYISFKERNYDLSTIPNVIKACEELGHLFIKNKRKEIGIFPIKR